MAAPVWYWRNPGETAWHPGFGAPPAGDASAAPSAHAGSAAVPAASPVDFAARAQLYHTELVERIVPFWLTHSLDTKHGGYYTLLDEKGQIYGRDKYMWLQGRQVWMLSRLYTTLSERKQEWLDAAKLGFDFLVKHGRDENHDWYFLLREDGHPIRVASNIYSDVFACMAMAAYHLASGDAQAKEICQETFEHILARRDNPKGKYEKTVPDARPMMNHTFPMILVNLINEVRGVVSDEGKDWKLDALSKEAMTTVLTKFLHADRHIIFENVAMDGSLMLDCPEGRLVNPGHGIESMGFMLRAALASNDRENALLAVRAMIWQLELGWDTKHRGITYFIDSEGFPTTQLEADQKLWWPHNEAEWGLLEAHKFALSLGEEGAELANTTLSWYHRIHDYTWAKFRDPVNGGEWFGYLNQDGTVAKRLKGGPWKGCFHVPRALMWSYQLAVALAQSTFSY